MVSARETGGTHNNTQRQAMVAMMVMDEEESGGWQEDAPSLLLLALLPPLSSHQFHKLVAAIATRPPIHRSALLLFVARIVLVAHVVTIVYAR
jgi:hypothetical protein